MPNSLFNLNREAIVYIDSVPFFLFPFFFFLLLLFFLSFFLSVFLSVCLSFFLSLYLLYVVSAVL